MPLATPFSLVLILLLGAVVLPVARRLGGVQIARVVGSVVAAGFFLWCLLLLGVRPAAFTASLWDPNSLFGAELGYRADEVSLLFLLLMATVTLIAALLSSVGLDEGRDHPLGHGLVFLVLAGASSVILSRDLVTLCLSWGFLDLALIFFTGLTRGGEGSSRRGFRLLLINYLAVAALLAALLVLQGLGQSVSLEAAPLPTKVVSLVVLAGLMRLGLYPAFLARASEGESGLGDVIVRYAVPVAVGGYLLVRVLSLTAVSWLPGREVALVMGTLAVVLSPFPLWFETALGKMAPYVVLHQVGHIALAAAIATPYSPTVITVQAVSLVLALALLSVSEAASRSTTSRWYALWTRGSTLLAVASLVGAPLTVGFVHRQLLYASLWESGLGPLVLLSLLGNSFLAAPLLKKGLESTSESASDGAGRPVIVASMTALAVPLIILGVHPPLLRLLIGPQSAPGLLDLISSPDTSASPVLFVGILVSLAGGYLMYRKGQFVVTGAGVSLETLHTIAEMEWFFVAVNWAAERLSSVLETVGGFFEERRSPGWILVFATLAALLLLSS
jgi:formate hydrogenlyase subunit 3/multisubunit Na+/H+ antiporter MnhD subunit